MTQTKTKSQQKTAGADVRPEGMPEGQAPAVQGAGRAPAKRPPTIAEKRRAVLEDMLKGIAEKRDDLEGMLAHQGITFEFFIGGLHTALLFTLKNDAEFFVADDGKQGVTTSSFFAAVYKAASDGLVCDGREAAIARFKREATYMPMVAGFMKKAHQSGQIADINSGVVTDKEDEAGRFEYEEGSRGYIRHRPSLSRTDKDKVVATYCVVRTVNGGEYREVVPEADLVKIRNVSRATKGPRKDWPLEMDRKAAVRRVFKRIPHDRALAQLLAHDDEAYQALPKPSEVVEEERAVSPGNLFAPTAQHREADEAEPEAEGEEDLPPPEDPVVEDVKTVDDTVEDPPTVDPEKAPNQGPIVDRFLKLLKNAQSPGELAEAIHDISTDKDRPNLTETSYAIVKQAIEDQQVKLGLRKAKDDTTEQGTLI